MVQIYKRKIVYSMDSINIKYINYYTVLYLLNIYYTYIFVLYVYTMYSIRK